MKSGWLAVALSAGIVIGIFFGRGTGTPATVEVVAKPADSAQGAATAPTPAENSTRTFTATPTPAAPFRPGSAAGASATHAPPVAAAAAPEAEADIQAIDAGPLFSKQFEDAAANGNRNAMADVHHALESEARDDSWAYPMEAEIENSLVADTGVGNFRKEHVECRASRCEVRLTARGAEQAAALQRWHDGLDSQPWSPRLYVSAYSVSTNDDNVDALLIFEKAPASPAQPRKN